MVGIGEVNTNIPGVYELTFDYTDEAGNDADTVIRKVNVINLAPHDLSFTSETNLVFTKINRLELWWQTLWEMTKIRAVFCHIN